MENKLFFDVLLYLKDKELYTEIDLFPFICDYNKRTNNCISSTKYIFDVLRPLESKKFIDYSADKKQANDFFVNAKGDDIKLTELNSLKATLNVDGYNFIVTHLKEIRQDRILEQGQSIAKKAMTVSIISAIIAALTLGNTILSSNNKEKIQQQTINLSSKTVDSLTKAIQDLTKSLSNLTTDKIPQNLHPIDTGNKRK